MCVCVGGGGGMANIALISQNPNIDQKVALKVHNVFPKVTFPPWLDPVSHRERMMEKTRKFQIGNAGLTNLCQTWLI